LDTGLEHRFIDHEGATIRFYEFVDAEEIFFQVFEHFRAE